MPITGSPGLACFTPASRSKGKQLPAKYRELVAIGAMIGQARMWGVKAHMERALAVGCTEQEILEALEAALIPVGSPPFRQAVNILMQVTGWKPASER